ncbi:hypothetical protein EIP86_010158 [Pleurotus ostreatoroseus]|nr:hypothetical protein EIP86_010158 [Pleurotus ostreatoroseus]
MGVAVGSMLLGAFAYQYYKANSLENVAAARVPVLPTPPPTRLVSYDELQKHNTSESCWLLINGHVYDATSVLRWHPAGPEPILENAGGHDAS